MRPDNVALVAVLSTGNRGRIALARCALEGAGIPYIVIGDLVQDLFTLGRLGTGFNLALGPAQIRVRSEDEDWAEGLLADLRGPDPGRVPLVVRVMATLLLVQDTAPIAIATILQR